jgi:hypothetical protein
MKIILDASISLDGRMGRAPFIERVVRIIFLLYLRSGGGEFWYHK